MTNGVFSDFELREMNIKITGSEEFVPANCVGSSEEELDVQIITKKCRGIIAKKVVKGAGTGKLKLSMHMPWEIYTEIYGMDSEGLIEGVKGYGTSSVHKTFATTQHVFDEDGVEKFKAYPNCIIETGVVNKIENGAEEVAEIELEVSLQPDEKGFCMYQALATELKDETTKSTWMTAFTPEMVQVENA